MKSSFQGQLKQVFYIMFDRPGCGTCIVHDERKKKKKILEKKKAAFFVKEFSACLYEWLSNYKHTTTSPSHPSDNPKRAQNWRY